VQDEPSLRDFSAALQAYPAAPLQGSSFTRHHQAMMRAHLERISRPGGHFEDTAVTGGPWRARERRVRMLLYRRVSSESADASATDALNDVALRWMAALASSGITAQRANGEAFYNWLLRWFNPRPTVTDGDPDALINVAPYPGDTHLPFGYEFAEQLLLSTPQSGQGAWWFDGLPHRLVTIQQLRTAPGIGHLTAERPRGEQAFALFDRLPEHTILGMTITVTAQHVIRNQIATVRRAAVGDSAEAAMTREDAEVAERQMASGNKLYPVDLAFYVRGDDIKDLRQNINRLSAHLLPNGLQPIEMTADLLAQDSYLKYLPMVFDPHLDKRRRRSRLMFSQHIANLLPVYGRSRGTGRPGLNFFNRGAEPLGFDPLHPEDRKKNAHMLILGPTGAGKSALLVYLLQQMLATYRPRVFIIEVGGSFDLFAQHLKRQDVSVHRVTLNANTDVSLPPFADAMKLRGSHTAMAALRADNEDDDADDGRDILGEMEIAARIMITGGDPKEDARMTRADRLLIRKSIYRAAQNVRRSSRAQVLSEDVVLALRQISLDEELPPERRHRSLEMADAMALFCSGLAGHFFNRPGRHWPLVDVTVLDMGLLAREGYEDQLTVAYLSMMSHINALVEAHQHEQRPTLVVTDEGHIITTNPLLSRYVVKITKMWRKLGAWFWIATQNLEDFPDASRRMLNMMEWWLCLVMPKEEVEQIARFKDLSDEQRRLLLSARKEPGKYTEGVVLADSLNALFRNVPPPLSLALAMTEKHEKAERARLMQELGCTELEAAYRIAERLAGE
jgi:conjugative transfer ATPase